MLPSHSHQGAPTNRRRGIEPANYARIAALPDFINLLNEFIPLLSKHGWKLLDKA